MGRSLTNRGEGGHSWQEAEHSPGRGMWKLKKWGVLWEQGQENGLGLSQGELECQARVLWLDYLGGREPYGR